jgi:hypothetical protein
MIVSSIFFALMIMFYKKGFPCFLDSHRWFIDEIFAIIGKQGCGPYACPPAARAVSGTFPYSAGAIAGLLLSFSDRKFRICEVNSVSWRSSDSQSLTVM